MKWYASVLFSISMTPLTAADQSYWRSDYESALTEAVESKRLVLLSFTGSDWCLWCRKLDRELFSQEPFQEGINHIAVPVQIDFPRHRQLPPREQRRNKVLQARFKVEAIPTVILYDPVTQKELLRHSYLETEPHAYLQSIHALISSYKGSE